jgi:hypothetical protein
VSESLCSDHEATIRTLTLQVASLTERAERAEARSEGINQRRERLQTIVRGMVTSCQQIGSLLQDMEDN